MTDRNKGKMDRTSYWGRRFETLCVLGVEGARLDELQRGPDDPPRPSYCALYRSRIGNHNVLMGQEKDACALLFLCSCCFLGLFFRWLGLAPLGLAWIRLDALGFGVYFALVCCASLLQLSWLDWVCSLRCRRCRSHI